MMSVLLNGKLYDQKKGSEEGCSCLGIPETGKINYTRAYMRKFDESPVANK